MKHHYITDRLNQERAVIEFNRVRPELEKLYDSKIKVIKMTRFPYILPVCWRVIYELESEFTPRSETS